MTLSKDIGIGTGPEMEVVGLTTEAESDTHTCVDVRASNPRRPLISLTFYFLLLLENIGRSISEYRGQETQYPTCQLSPRL